MTNQIEISDGENITSIEGPGTFGLQRFLWASLALGGVYILGLLVSSAFHRPNYSGKLAPYLIVPNHAEVVRCEMFRYDPPNPIVEAEIAPPPGVSEDAFMDSVAKLNLLTWTKHAGTVKAGQMWKASKGSEEFMFSRIGQTGRFNLVVLETLVYRPRSVKPAVPPGASSSTSAYPVRIGGKRSSIGSHGPTLPKTGYTGP